ncbi:MAG: hypothetical protein AUJ92_11745 [Armatimonadetes bacterium CG2_30_59_28]|nr:hypothetical protein [Armatimonadota bacterium]OIO93708.1 MAG: hypothetical protein AUJ92_11745 [Armatimonadetes bacterium CG2_30_59_28]PIU60438.1 MAG: hypothetical protein COS85_24485 [Armatimonadetes bacterium CG07_land_8_20_14_0_80_59_28]PIX43823.1 MAG: hypothetical protein COZ56_06240 [Armatimonadetes bacterium CG_4_8_14_3_um_filter_58_9]PIY44237.1 MAG: hypothetical protein COZ05_08695 [Armatimonadetes bacterium CG_4_10_14_3_um_filter_59_10]
MTVDTMTPRQRWLAAMHMRPVDRLPFWPKINASYVRAQRSPFSEMTVGELHEWVGSDNHLGIPTCAREVRTRTSQQISQDNGTTRITYRTPHGDMQCVHQFDEASQSNHPMEFPVKNVDDIWRMTDFYEDTKVELHDDGVRNAKKRVKEIGEKAVTTDGIGTSPLMHWVQYLAGVEMAHHLLADYSDEVDALFDAIHRVLVEKTKILAAHSPADLIYVTENTSTTLISPRQYRRYCLRHIAEYARIARSADRNMVLHMCGHLKDLLPDLATLPVRAFEAFTSPTVGNTTLRDGRSACPDICLIGGTNAALWTQPADRIIAQIEEDLDALPHHRGLVVTSAGVMPPRCKPDTIREVGAFVRSYRANCNGQQ